METQDILLQSDKVYSILAILLMIFGALIGYMVVTERKLQRLEKKMDEKNK